MLLWLHADAATASHLPPPPLLQWWWTAANSCRVPGAPRWVGSSAGMLPCTEPGPYPEEFRNCADIRIGGGGGDSGSDSGSDSWDGGDEGEQGSGDGGDGGSRPAQQQREEREGEDGGSGGRHDHGGTSVVASRAQRSTAGRGKAGNLQGGAACKVSCCFAVQCG